MVMVGGLGSKAAPGLLIGYWLWIGFLGRSLDFLSNGVRAQWANAGLLIKPLLDCVANSLRFMVPWSLPGLRINYLLGVRVPWSLPGLHINYLLGVRVPWSLLGLRQLIAGG